MYLTFDYKGATIWQLSAKKLKHYEKKKTYTNRASRFRIDKSMLSQIENGKATPSMKTLQYIAEKLECEPSFLLEEDEGKIVELIQKWSH